MNPDITNLKLEMEMAIGWAMSTLDDREKLVVEGRFLYQEKPETLDQLAEKIGKNRERVRQIQQKAVRKMRNFLCSGLRVNYGEDVILLLKERDRLDAEPSRSRPSLPGGHAYVPVWRPKGGFRRRKLDPPTKKPKHDTDNDWVFDLWKQERKPRPDDFRTKQPYPYTNPKDLPWIENHPCTKLAKTWVRKVQNRKYVHFEENKRFPIYKTLERRGWVRDNDGRYFNPKSGSVRSIIFRQCHWKKGWVWMNVTFASSVF